MGTHGIEERNENVERSMDFLEINNLVIKANKGTIFPHKPKDTRLPGLRRDLNETSNSLR